MKRLFPEEFHDLISPKYLDLLQNPKWIREQQEKFSRHTETPFIHFADFLDSSKFGQIIETLGNELETQNLFIENNAELPVAKELYSLDYDLSLFPLCHRARATRLYEDPKALQICKESGLVEMLNSQSYKQTMLLLTGYSTLKSIGNDTQIGLYHHGDYIGPHADWAGSEDGTFTRYYLETHLAFSNHFVDHMYLILQNGRHLNKVIPIANQGALTLYRLPYWHMTSPLQAKSGSEALAKRWNIMSSMLIDIKEFPQL